MRIDLLVKKIGEVGSKLEATESYDTIYITKDKELYVSEVGSECLDEDIEAIVIGYNVYLDINNGNESEDLYKSLKALGYKIIETSANLTNPIKYMLNDIDIYDLGLEFTGDVNDMYNCIVEIASQYFDNIIYDNEREDLIKEVLDEYGIEDFNESIQEYGGLFEGAAGLKESEIISDMDGRLYAGEYNKIDELLTYQYDAGNC